MNQTPTSQTISEVTEPTCEVCGKAFHEVGRTICWDCYPDDDQTDEPAPATEDTTNQTTIVSDNPLSFERSEPVQAPCLYCERMTVWYCEVCNARMCADCTPGDVCPECHPEQFAPAPVTEDRWPTTTLGKRLRAATVAALALAITAGTADASSLEACRPAGATGEGFPVISCADGTRYYQDLDGQPYENAAGAPVYCPGVWVPMP